MMVEYIGRSILILSFMLAYSCSIPKHKKKEDTLLNSNGKSVILVARDVSGYSLSKSIACKFPSNSIELTTVIIIMENTHKHTEKNYKNEKTE